MPATRRFRQAKANEKAYAAWRARHKALLAELDAARDHDDPRSSKDEKDYMRNIGNMKGLSSNTATASVMICWPSRATHGAGLRRLPQLPDWIGL